MTTLTTYTLQVLSPEDENGYAASGIPYAGPDADKRVLANLPAYVETWQEDMTSLLPEGYSVEIREWHDAEKL